MTESGQRRGKECRRGSRGGEMGEFSPPIFLSPFLSKSSCFSAISISRERENKKQLQTKQKVSHGIFNLTFRMLQHTSSEVTVTKYDRDLKRQKLKRGIGN